MSIFIGKYKFQGPYTSNSKLEDRPGIYAIHCYEDGKYMLLDIGESARVKSRVLSHDRINCWQHNCSGNITVSVYYTPHWTQEGRSKLQERLRKLYSPPCGKKSDGLINFLKKKG